MLNWRKAAWHLATRYGDPDLAVQVNGLDVAMHDPRAFSGQALAYVTSPRGACHNQSDFFNVELGGTIDEIGISASERWEDAGKAEKVKLHQHWRTVCNSLVNCFFAVVNPSELAPMLSAATGENWDVERLMKAGERAWNLKRAINIRLGLTRATEKLPKLLLQALSGRRSGRSSAGYGRSAQGILCIQQLGRKHRQAHSREAG